MPARDREHLATAALRATVNAAAVVSVYGGPIGIEDSDVVPLIDRLVEDVKDVWAGDMKRAESMLFGQAHALQSIFMNLARRAQRQEHLKHWEAYLRMALKAQNQCRMTLETLATIKNPPVVFARQANINNGGQQQVNNGAAPVGGQEPAREAAEENAPTGLLEQQHVEWMDSGTACAAGRADSQLAPVGEVHRPAHCYGKESRVAQRVQGRSPGDASRAGEDAEGGTSRAGRRIAPNKVATSSVT
jgi:hypothetical protein